jgi:hypothetical protein
LGSGALRFAGLFSFRHELFGKLVGVPGVLVRLFGEFVSGQMIPFVVCGGCSLVCVRRKVVKFRGLIVRVL